MTDLKIAVLRKKDLTRFSSLFYNELLLTVPDDVIALGAIDTGSGKPQPAGILMFHVRERSAYIDWLYVAEDYRKQKVGSALLGDMRQELTRDPKAAVNTVFMNFGEAIEGMGGFLRSNGFGVTFYDGNFNIYAPLKSVRMIKQVPTDLKAVPLSEVPRESFAGFDKYLNMTENEFICVATPILPEEYRAESRAVLNGNRIVGIMLVGDTLYRDTIIIDWIYSLPKYVPGAVPLAFDTVITELRRDLPPDTMISMASLTEKVGSIIRKTMPGAAFSEAYSAFLQVER